jgi:hypothetical protein
MITLHSLYVNISRVKATIKFPFNSENEKDATSYVFLSTNNSIEHSDLLASIAEIKANDFYLDEEALKTKSAIFHTLILNENVKKQMNGLAVIYPVEDKMNILLTGDLCVLHFRGNKFLIRHNGIFNSITKETISVEMDDVLIIALQKEIENEIDYNAISSKAVFPEIFIDKVSSENDEFMQSAIYKDRLEKIAAKFPSKPRVKTIETREEILAEEPFKKPKKNCAFKKWIKSESIRNILVGVLCFLTGFLIVISIMYLLRK